MPSKQEKMVEKIKKDNEKFAKLSPRRKRVQIACDVLRQIAQKRIKPTNGTWVHGLKLTKILTEPKEAIDRSFAPIKTCHACALGAMFVAATCRKMVFSQDYTGQWVSFPDIKSAMRDIFSTQQLKEIEVAFERGDGDCIGSLAAQHYLPEVRNATARMTSIMQNIVRNRGTFKPKDNH